MKRLGCVAILPVVVVACQSAPKHQLKLGPPPPGYIKIRGEAVPGWEPSHMTAGPRDGERALTWHPLGPRPLSETPQFV